MPEDILICLGARRAELETTIQRYLAEREAIDAYIASHRKLDELNLFEKLDLKFGSAEATPRPEQAKTPYQSVVFCRVKIIELRRPLTIHELQQFVTDEGFVISTPKPVATLSARLRDHADKLGFIFLPRHGWWLNHLPYAPASYYPNPPTGEGSHAG
jgi:hypothetical protein